MKVNKMILEVNDDVISLAKTDEKRNRITVSNTIPEKRYYCPMCGKAVHRTTYCFQKGC